VPRYNAQEAVDDAKVILRKIPGAKNLPEETFRSITSAFGRALLRARAIQAQEEGNKAKADELTRGLKNILG
jgi:hypothetical protein